MGEIIDTKPIQSVQAAISLFSERNDQKRNKSPKKDESEKEEELDDLLKHFANIKVRLEAKDSAYKQTLLQLENYQKTVDELSTLLKSSEIEKDIYLNQCKEATTRVSELESTINNMAYQLAGSLNIGEQLSHVLSELKAAEEQVLRLETEVAAEKDAKLESMKQIEEVETALNMEKLKTEELSRQVLELNETVMHLKLAAAEAEKENNSLISKKEMEIKLVETAATEAQEQLQSFMKRLEMMRTLENQILDKSMYIESLQEELYKAKALHGSSEKVAFDAICELNQLKADLELKEGKNRDQASYVNLLETKLQEQKLEFSIANEEMNSLTGHVEEMKEELEKTKSKAIEARKEVTEAEVEIALLKSELHQGRSRIAAAAAAEERAKNEITAVYATLEQLELEFEETKKENQQLKAAGTVAEESESYFTPCLQHEDCTKSREDPSIDSKTLYEEGENYENGEEVRISKEKYEGLIKMAKEAEELKLGHECWVESENLKKELEIAASKVAEFRTRAEQAISRAEIAEKAKAALEEERKKWKERRAKKKAALAALQEESISKEIVSYRYKNAPPKVYQPLGKVLNIKF